MARARQPRERVVLTTFLFGVAKGYNWPVLLDGGRRRGATCHHVNCDDEVTCDRLLGGRALNPLRFLFTIENDFGVLE